MATTIPKLNIEICALHSVRKKLQCLGSGKPLNINPAERKVLLDLIAAGKKRLYPDAMALDRYQYHIDEIAKVEPGSSQFDYFAKQIATFEQTYCE